MQGVTARFLRCRELPEIGQKNRDEGWRAWRCVIGGEGGIRKECTRRRGWMAVWKYPSLSRWLYRFRGGSCGAYLCTSSKRCRGSRWVRCGYIWRALAGERQAIKAPVTLGRFVKISMDGKFQLQTDMNRGIKPVSRRLKFCKTVTGRHRKRGWCLYRRAKRQICSSVTGGLQLCIHDRILWSQTFPR